jgi:hypothetical protein
VTFINCECGETIDAPSAPSGDCARGAGFGIAGIRLLRAVNRILVEKLHPINVAVAEIGDAEEARRAASVLDLA